MASEIACPHVTIPGMGRSLSLIGITLVVAVGGYLYTQQASGVMPGGGTPKAAIDVTRVRMDLMALANAERTYFATNGTYASLEELRAHGDAHMVRDSRPHFAYSAETSARGFTIIASYSGPDTSVPPRITIDETMTVRTE